MKLREVFAKALREQPSKITDDCHRDAMRKWDSLRHLDLVIGLEEAYGIQLSTAEVLSLSSFSDAKQLLIERGLQP